MILSGKVIKKSGDKTIKIVYSYNKYYSKIKLSKTIEKFIMIHDENNEAKIGDYVEYISCPPFSKRKAFKLASIKNNIHK